jgi:hypothetical protein
MKICFCKRKWCPESKESYDNPPKPKKMAWNVLNLSGKLKEGMLLAKFVWINGENVSRICITLLNSVHPSSFSSMMVFLEPCPYEYQKSTL